MAWSDLEIHHCITCGVEYAGPKSLFARHREVGGYHSCPNGHSQGWAKNGSELERIRRERDRLKQQSAQKDDELRDKDRQLAASKGQMTKLKKRISHGVCPCCSRTFQNLARHMQTKHPEETKLQCVS